MITLFIGENSFEIERELRQLITKSGLRPEKFDGSELELNQLMDVLMGVSLFAEKRLVIVKNLSENSTLWTDFSEWIDRVSDDIELVLVESKPDKRTKTYKDLQKRVSVHEFKPWTDRDRGLAQEWGVVEAKRRGVKLTTAHARAILDKTGVDQWRIYQAIEKLALADTIDERTIDAVVEQSPHDSIFTLLEAALKGNIAEVQQRLASLSQVEDAYRTFGLLSSQIMQLASLVFSEGKTANEVAKDIGAHPFVLSKLAPYAKRLSHAQAKHVVNAAAKVDMQLKSTSVDPWMLVEKLLVEIASEVTTS